MNKDLEVKRKNDQTLTFNFTDDDGVAIDITGYTIGFTVKAEFDDDDTDTDSNTYIKKNLTLSSPTTGVATLALTDTETDIPLGNYLWDLRIKDDGGLYVNTLAGRLRITNTVGLRNL